MHIIPEADAANQHQAAQERQVFLKPETWILNICHPNQTNIEMANITPPPRSTIVVCELRSFGLSMMLKWSAILKYTSSASNSSTAIIPYVIIIIIP